MFAWFAWLSVAAWAYETDQLTDRHLPLADARIPANVEANRLIGQAIERTNRKTSCDATPAKTKRVLAKQLHRTLMDERWVWSRGLFRAPGYTAYSGWMATSPDVERRSVLKPRHDIYSSLTLWHSFVLTVAGPAGTYNIDGVLMGPDKPDHFFDLGYTYWKRSHDGAQPLRAIRWGTATENTIYGMFTSKTFSFADLASNYDGYLWYLRLLGDDSELQLGDDGCVELVGAFDWTEWVRWEWDEVLNPNVHTRLVQRGLVRHLEKHREAYCSSYAEWGPREEYSEHLGRVLTDPTPYAAGRVPPRSDPYQLASLCAGL